MPENHADLNYTRVRFEWNPAPNAVSYLLEVAFVEEGASTDTLRFQTDGRRHAVEVEEGLEFGKSYIWRVNALNPDGSFSACSGPDSFRILYSPKVDTALFRHEVLLSSSGPNENTFIFIDNPGVLIDLSGRPVWFHPDPLAERVFNVQMLENGNIAALLPKGRRSGNENLRMEEISLRGQSVWRAPRSIGFSGDSSEYYHHDFQKLKNGNYLLAGNSILEIELPGQEGTTLARYGTLIEYEPSGKAVWTWNSGDYLAPEDVFAAGVKDNPTHLNGFYLDESTGFLYVSFRYIDRIVKLDYKRKKVLNSFGSKLPSGEAYSANGFFHQQHSPFVKGDLMYVYDNGSGKDPDTLSSALIFRMGEKPAGSQGRIIYRGLLDFGSRQESWSESKGDVDLLPDGRLLTNMGSLPRTVILDTAKGIVWSCLHQSRASTSDLWQGLQENYRADWTESLYPVAFDPDISMPDAGRNIVVSIQNDGLRPDRYRIILAGKRKGAVKTIRTKTVGPGSRLAVRISARHLHAAGFEIVSETNSAIRRKLLVNGF